MKIMIVDDHADIRRMLKTVISAFSTEAVEIIECESGEEAVAKYPLHRPDYVLMDFEMHQMNGFEATEIICNHDQTAKVVIVTGYNNPSMKKKAQELNVQGFVSKDNLSKLKEILYTIK